MTRDSGRARQRPPPGYVHDGLLFSSPRQLADTAAPFLQAGLDGDDRVALVCSDALAGELIPALGADPRIGLLDADDVFGSPSSAVATYHRLAADVPPGRRLRVLAEVRLGTGHRAWERYAQLDALADSVVRDAPVWAVCAVDTAQVPAEVLAAVGTTHRHLLGPAGRRANPLYESPADLLRSRLPGGPYPVEATPPDVRVRAESPADLGPVRRAMGDVLDGRVERAVQDGVLLATTEVVTNGLEHGQPPVDVRAWVTGDHVLCAVRDQGEGFEDPLTGLVPPELRGAAASGHGLWLTRQLCDRVETSRNGTGFTVRLVVRAAGVRQ